MPYLSCLVFFDKFLSHDGECVWNFKDSVFLQLPGK